MHPLFTRSAREMGLSKTAHELQKGPHCQKPTLTQVKTLGSKVDKDSVRENAKQHRGLQVIAAAHWRSPCNPEASKAYGRQSITLPIGILG